MACLRGMNQVRALVYNSGLRGKLCSHAGWCYQGASVCDSGHDREASSPGVQCRSISTSLKNCQPTNVLQEIRKRQKYAPNRSEDFKEIYRFKFLLPTRVLCRIKLYQTGFSVFILPMVGTMYFYDVMSLAEFEGFFVFTGVALGMLYIMTGYFRRIACVVYFSREEQALDISHLTFWGKRQDTRIQLDDIMPFTDTLEKLNSTYIEVKTYSGQTFYLFLHHSRSGDVETLKNLLGISP